LERFESVQPTNLHVPSFWLAKKRKLTADELVHPGKTGGGGHEPSSYVATGLNSPEVLSMQPPMMQVPSSTTANAR
jgi:hypothetical protein